ncbi:MAG: flagellar basal body protein [Burkholderiales bacterium]
MSISALGSGLAGMQAFQNAVDLSANNVANAETTGFQPLQASFQDSAGGGVNVTATGPTVAQSAAAVGMPSGTDLVAETVSSLQYQFGFDLSAQVVKAADQTLGTLINTVA